MHSKVENKDKQHTTGCEITILNPTFSRYEQRQEIQKPVSPVFLPKRLIVNMISDKQDSEHIC